MISDSVESTNNGGSERVRGLRGATVVAEDRRDLVSEAVKELLTELMERNGVSCGDIVSATFTLTGDVRSEFPARAARELDGWNEVPMLCAVEVDVPASLPRCIRVLVYVYTTLARAEVKHVYLRDARQLRPDFAGDI